jgi:hypothetical protein
MNRREPQRNRHCSNRRRFRCFSTQPSCSLWLFSGSWVLNFEKRDTEDTLRNQVKHFTTFIGIAKHNRRSHYLD